MLISDIRENQRGALGPNLSSFSDDWKYSSIQGHWPYGSDLELPTYKTRHEGRPLMLPSRRPLLHPEPQSGAHQVARDGPVPNPPQSGAPSTGRDAPSHTLPQSEARSSRRGCPLPHPPPKWSTIKWAGVPPSHTLPQRGARQLTCLGCGPSLLDIDTPKIAEISDISALCWKSCSFCSIWYFNKNIWYC